SLTVGTSLTSAATAGLTNVISGPVIADNATLTETTGNLTLSGQVTASGLTGTVSAGTLKLTNVSAAAANSITGTFTVNSGGTLEGLAASGTGSNALGTAAVTLSGGTLRLTPALTDTVPGAVSGLTGKYYNLGFQPTAAAQVDFTVPPSGTATVATVNSTTAIAGLPTGLGTGGNNYAALFEGFVKINTAGIYTFATNSDDGSLLYVDGTQ